MGSLFRRAWRSLGIRELTKDEVEKAKRLCRQSGRTVWIFKGIPSFGFEEEWLQVPCYLFSKPHFPSDENGFDPKPGQWNDAMMEIERVNYFNWLFPFENHCLPLPDGRIVPGTPCPYCDEKFLIATRKARSARFEHGE
jgi:hypothetical protein